jgi:DNA invertase Pin-like site-specific DNA recombinase
MSEFSGQTAGIYPRVSTLAQSDDDKASLDAQIESCREYGEDLGMIVDEVCIRKEAHTATSSDRPELEALLRDMKARRVRNLVIDRADRLTREGQVAAAIFLKEFTSAGIVLHVVSMDLRVRDSQDVKNFLDAAYAAEQANVARMRALRMARKSYARKGRYLKGNRPPYGFLCQPVEWDSKGRPTIYHLVADLREVSGHRPWDVRRRICLDAIRGESTWAIAKALTEEGVPTSRSLAGQRHAQTEWSPSTISDLLHAPLTMGKATSFRQRYEVADPDKKHTGQWKRQVEIAPEKQIAIPGIVIDPVLSEDEVEALRARLSVRVPRSPVNADLAHWAMLRGALAICAQCGKGLRVKADKRVPRRASVYYVCRSHEVTPSRCPGLWVSVVDLDLAVWVEVLDHLRTPEKFRELAAKQARSDTDETPSTRLQHRKNVVADFARKAANLLSAVGDVDDPDLRADLLADLTRTRENLRQAEAELAAYERLAADDARRLALLGNIDLQALRYMKRISDLSHRMIEATKNPDGLTMEDVESLHTICLSLGVRPVVRRGDDGQLAVKVEFNIGAATGTPWFNDGEEMDYAPPNESC